MKILVADDDQRIVRTTCDILRFRGYEAVPVFSGEEAVRQVTEDPLDCVLMDIKMPGISGVEALHKIRELRPDLPVVLASAYASAETIAIAKDAGAYAVLTKPVDFQRVLSFLSLLRKQESILIVDDDPEFCRTLSDILTSHGCRVESESRPGEVLPRMEGDYKLLVLIDLRLGDADGVEVLQVIRARYPTKPIIVVTGYGDEMAAAMEKCRQIGAYTLCKPFEAEVLFELIEQISHMKRKAALHS